MKTNTITTLVLAAAGIAGFGYGLTQINAANLPTVAQAIGFVAAGAILAIAAMDNTRVKRLS